MDDLWPLLSLVGLAYLLAPIVGLVLAFRNRAQLRELDRRIEELARRIAPAPPAAPAAETLAPPITAPQEPPLLAIDESPALLVPKSGVPKISDEPPAVAPVPSAPAAEPAPPAVTTGRAIPATRSRSSVRDPQILRATLRHALGRMDRRRRARARWHLPGQLRGGAGLLRARHAHPARVDPGRVADRRRRVGAPHRAGLRSDRYCQRACAERPHRGRNHRGVCHRLCGVRAVRLHRSGSGLRVAGRDRHRHARRGPAARPRAGGTWPGRCTSNATAGDDADAELLGALHLSCGGDGCGLCARPRAVVALARHLDHRRRRPLGAARHR